MNALGGPGDAILEGPDWVSFDYDPYIHMLRMVIEGYVFHRPWIEGMAATAVGVESVVPAVFGRIGLVPDLGMFHLLPRVVGLARAKELIYSARVVPAEEAQALGIVYAVHPPEQLLPAAQALAKRFSHASREALGLSKNILNQALHLDAHALEDMESHAQAVCMSTDYYQDAVQRTLDRQPLAFDWERLGREG